MKNTFTKIIGILGCIILMLSCQKETMNIRGNISEPNSGEFLKSEVHVFDNSIIDEISEPMNVENNTMTFSSSLSREQLPQVGQIVASDTCKNLPYGLLARVVSVEKKLGNWEVVMEDVGLDEVFQDLQIDTVITLSEGNIGTFYDANGNIIIPVDSEVMTKGDDNKDEIMLGAKFSDGEFSTSINVSHTRFKGKGVISYGARVGYRNMAFRLNFDKKEKFYASIEPFINLSGSYEAISKKDVFGDDDPLTLYLHELPSVRIIVYGIPVILRPQVLVTMESELSAAAKFKTEFNFDTGIFMMMKYENGWDTDFDFRSNIDENRIPFNVTGVELSGTIGSGIGVEYFVGLYGKGFGSGLKASLNIENTASFTLDSDLDEILDLNPELETDINIYGQASFKSKIWGIKLFNDLYVKTAPFHIFRTSMSILPRFMTFSPTEKDGNYILRHDVNEFSLSTLLGNGHGWSLFDESKELISSHYSQDGTHIKDVIYRYESPIESLQPGKKYYVAPMAELAGLKLHGKKTPLEADKRVKFCFRCESQSYDVLTFEFDLSKAASNSIDVRYDANDYDGSPMSMHITGIYNTDTQTFTGAVDFLFYDDPGQQRIDGFSINLSGSDSNYVTCSKIIDNGGCSAAIRIYEVGGPQQTESACEIPVKSMCNIGLYNPYL